MRNRSSRGWGGCLCGYSWRKTGLFFLFFFVLWFYTLTSVMLLNRETDEADTELMKDKILDISKRYVKAVAQENVKTGGKNAVPDAEGFFGKMRNAE